MVPTLLEDPVKVINIGIREFMEALEEQEIPVIHVEWRPPTDEGEEIDTLLESLL